MSTRGPGGRVDPEEDSVAVLMGWEPRRDGYVAVYHTVPPANARQRWVRVPLERIIERLDAVQFREEKLAEETLERLRNGAEAETWEPIRVLACDQMSGGYLEGITHLEWAALQKEQGCAPDAVPESETLRFLVADGHHRVAVARERGETHIRAIIVLDAEIVLDLAHEISFRANNLPQTPVKESERRRELIWLWKRHHTWGQRRLANAAGLSQSQVSRILAEAAVDSYLGPEAAARLPAKTKVAVHGLSGERKWPLRDLADLVSHDFVVEGQRTAWTSEVLRDADKRREGLNTLAQGITDEEQRKALCHWAELPWQDQLRLARQANQEHWSDEEVLFAHAPFASSLRQYAYKEADKNADIRKAKQEHEDFLDGHTQTRRPHRPRQPRGDAYASPSSTGAKHIELVQAQPASPGPEQPLHVPQGNGATTEPTTEETTEEMQQRLNQIAQREEQQRKSSDMLVLLNAGAGLSKIRAGLREFERETQDVQVGNKARDLIVADAQKASREVQEAIEAVCQRLLGQETPDWSKYVHVVPDEETPPSPTA